jgi:hypothetical protein
MGQRRDSTIRDNQMEPSRAANPGRKVEKVMERREIYVGFGDTFPPEDGSCGKWSREKVFVIPLIDGISDNVWKQIYKKTNEYKPMYEEDGSAVFCDDENWQIVRKVGGKCVKIADIVAYI